MTTGWLWVAQVSHRSSKKPTGCSILVSVAHIKQFSKPNLILLQYFWRDFRRALVLYFCSVITSSSFRLTGILLSHSSGLCIGQWLLRVLCYYWDEPSNLAHFHPKCQLWLITLARALHHLMHLPRPTTTEHTSRLSNRTASFGGLTTEKLQYVFHQSKRIFEECHQSFIKLNQFPKDIK